MAATRKALIITNPGEIGAENYCEGVNKDAELYKNFMLSPVGGSWRAEEIRTLKRPFQVQAFEAVSALKGADYSVVAFCGHGYYSASRSTTTLELKTGNVLDEVELRQGATKRMIILDCCRVVHTLMALDEEMRKALAKADAVVDPAESRRYYDKAISECRNGIVVLFGCAIDETAGDDAQRGGIYSYNLVGRAKSWARDEQVDDEHYSVLSVVGAHESASPQVVRLSGGTQHPEILKPGTGPYFPFGIVV